MTLTQAVRSGDAQPGPGPYAQLDRSPYAQLDQAPLGPAALGRLVSGIAAAPHRWRPVVRFGQEQRWYGRLDLTEEYEIWLLSWLPGQETGFHDHGEANGAFAVAEGEVRERTAAPGRPGTASRMLRSGQARAFGRSHIHDVSNISAGPAVTVHAYSPPLTAMRRYQLTGSGLVLARTDLAGRSW